jgi:hypothetical protein
MKISTGCERGVVNSYLESGKTPKEDAKKKKVGGIEICANTGSSTSEREGRKVIEFAQLSQFLPGNV